MFGIGPMELGVIILVALLVLGPKRLPEVMKMMGKMMAELKKAAEDVKKEIVQEDDLRGIQDSLREIGDVPRLVQRQLEKEVADLEAEDTKKNDGAAVVEPVATVEPVVPEPAAPAEGETHGNGTETGPADKPAS
jgi:Tat protein translocase TatB subunit